MASALPVTLRRCTAQDAQAIAQLMAQPGVQPNTMQLPYANVASWQARLPEMLAPGNADLMLVAERPDAHGEATIVGSAGLHPCGPGLRRRHAMALGISVAAQAQGQGVGTALMAALCDYADRWAQVLRIELTVFADNARAIALYERFGFHHEGRHLAYALRDGQYVDALAMARLHPSPPTWRAG